MRAGTLPHPLVIEQGKTLVWTVGRAVARRDGHGQLQYDDAGQLLTDPVDLSGYSARMQARASVSATGTLLDVSTGTGHLVVDGSAGTITLTIPASETAALDFTTGVFDIEAYRTVNTVEEVLGIVAGKVKLDKEVTR